MKYAPEAYAAALRETISRAPAGERDEIIKRFAALLHKTGDIARAGKIIRAFEKLAVKNGGGRWVEVEFARPLDKKLVQKIEKSFQPKDHFEKVINPALIAGTRATVDGEQELDNSLARKLKRMFNSHQ